MSDEHRRRSSGRHSDEQHAAAQHDESTPERPERRRTRTLTVSPWVKGILVAGATSAFLSLPAVLWHAERTMRSIDGGMQAVRRMALDYKTTREQNVVIQLQLHRLTDAVNDLRHDKGLAPIEQSTIVGAAPAEAMGAAATGGLWPSVVLLKQR